jgi:hypothetical protein
MNTEIIEIIIRGINSLKYVESEKFNLDFSMDLYYDDIKGQFVVRLSNTVVNGVPLDDKHFRYKSVDNCFLNSYHYLLPLTNGK